MGKGRISRAFEIDGFKLGWRENTATADFRDQETGKRRRISLGPAKTEAQGRTLLERFVLAQRNANGTNATPTIGALWVAWMEDRASDGFENRIYGYNWRALEATFSARIATEISADDCRQYARSRFDIGRAPATVHTELVRLRHCLKWAAKTRLIAFEPHVWTPSKGGPRKLTLSPEEMLRLYEAAHDPHVGLFIILLISTGARHRAVLDLTWDRVDWNANTVQYEDDIEVDPMSKTWRKGRATVAMNKTLRAELERAFAGRQTDHVIEHGGRRLVDARTGFKAAVFRAGLDPRTSPHTIRHSVATIARQQGADVERVAHLLGHEDSATTRLIYSHLDASFSSDVTELLDIRSAGSGKPK